MKLSISDGVFYVDNVFLCYCEAGNGRDDLQLTRCEVSTQYSAAHKQELPHAFGLGWIGPAASLDVPECDIVLGSVRSRQSLVPCASYVGRLLAMLEVAEGAGKTNELVVSN